MIIDTHVHFWNFDPVRDAWIDQTMEVIRKDFVPADVLKVADEQNVKGFVAVQADQSEVETHYLLSLARTHSEIKGVVGWLDLCDPNLNSQIENYSGEPLLKGLRHIVQAEPPGFMDRQDFRQGISALKDTGLTYDILVYAPQLEEAARLVSDFPDQPFILDHLGKPNIREGKLASWQRDLDNLAAYPNCYCKLSGLVTEAHWNSWTAAQLEPYLETALEAFGPNRLVFGSDWPVCRLAGTYSQVLELVLQVISNLSPIEQHQILWQNAIQFYNLNP
jgi:L-fuconolactonase